MHSKKKLCLIAFVSTCLEILATPEPNTSLFKQTPNASYNDKTDLSSIASIFSPRMDFDQWKPLTGRGDPLRNDPTYDYEPPVLERVHYWADDSRSEREKYPERKSEVLVLGVSSRKPSVASRPPVPTPSRRLTRPPGFSNKYEDYTYKFGEHYPMTILVPPPPPPAGQKPPLFILNDDKFALPTFPPKPTDSTQIIRDTTTTPELITSYAFQEANLIYQESTLKQQNWFNSVNKTTSLPNNTVSSDYAGWGPTTPFDDVNDSHNIISYNDHHNIEFTKEPLAYYKPMFSQAPPLPETTEKTITSPAFLPTVLPPLSTNSDVNEDWPSVETTQETSTETQHYYRETTTEKATTPSFHPTPAPVKSQSSIINMLGSMISMPMVTDPDRPEDHLYAHASNTVQIFKEHTTEEADLEKMQTMQPPPPIKHSETVTETPRQPFHINPHILNNFIHEKATGHTNDPYLHMRFTTPPPTVTEAQTIPTYLIIQGHSKVKTYGSKPKPLSGAGNNEIQKPNETNEVKHLHPIKDKYSKKTEKIDPSRESRAINLKSLVDNGLGSIEIQEADVGIKYDVSDGSKVPIEIYRKGIVDSDENDYSHKHKLSTNERTKRHINIENILSIEDSLEDDVYDLFSNKKNGTVFSKLISEEILNDDDDESTDDR
ncbi:uncharacterized protein LOC116768743 [Danaus plexippus]|uniref:uncharacterized protein LOC116768743 n=1 Tax=Danaus plexippus TaxID=13037 RepID=UPI002AB30E8C|nr:uncharacterized protein LOC116768743 [Danaus plexippus]